MLRGRRSTESGGRTEHEGNGRDRAGQGGERSREDETGA